MNLLNEAIYRYRSNDKFRYWRSVLKDFKKDIPESDDYDDEDTINDKEADLEETQIDIHREDPKNTEELADDNSQGT